MKACEAFGIPHSTHSILRPLETSGSISFELPKKIEMVCDTEEDISYIQY